ncbi:MAG: hypothetical protein H7Z12_12840 [Rhodospirillaceae bacterium]|nr:hypothetical protein [Rhodospirillales bacterium]
MRFGVLVAGTAALMLSGCLGQGDLERQSTVVSAPPGVALPLPARTMLYMAPRDLDRPLIIEATLHRNEETKTPDGRTLEKAAKAVLSQAFAQVETNQTTIRPQLVIKVMGTPQFSRRDNLMKIGCGLDVFQADGSMLGSFVARFNTKNPVDYGDALEPAYKLCLKSATDQMLASPAVIRAAKAGGEPHPAGYKSFIESLGLRP